MSEIILDMYISQSQISLPLTVSNPQTLFVTVGIVEHEADGEEGLQEDQREDRHHGEGSHHRVGFLQVVTGNLRGGHGERILLLLLLDIRAVSLVISDLVRISQTETER